MLKVNSNTTNFKNCLAAHDLQYQPIDVPTYYSSFHNSASLLDLIITSISFRIIKFVQLDLSILDHDFICFSYDLPNNDDPALSFEYRSYKDINYECLFADCATLQWESMYDKYLIDDKVSILNNLIQYLFQKHVPIKSFVKSQRITPVWFNSDIELAMVDREMCYKMWKKHKTNENRNIFRRMRKIVKKLIRKAKSDYIRKQLDFKLSSRQLWKNIRNIGLSNDRPAIPQFSVNELNTYFVDSIPVSINASQSIPNYMQDSTFGNFYFNSVEDSNILAALYKIKSNAIGDDCIPLKFIKIIMPFIIPYFSHIVNTCLTASVFPAQWKVSRVTPIPKGKQPKQLSDLRPISVLPVFSKVVEILMHGQIISFLNANNKLNLLQSGFRENHSTVTALLKITDDISCALDNGNVVLLVLLDFSKAFDTLNHCILLNKLRAYFSFSYQAVKLIENYLSNRFQYVEHNSVKSVHIETTRGVPQGSILGPLLFSLFINDISSVLSHCDYHIYADDVQIYQNTTPESINLLATYINNDLNEIFNWATINDLQLNATKSKVLRIYRGKDQIPFPLITLGQDIISYTDKVRNLGFIMNSNLTWDDQVNFICSNIYAGLKSLSKFRHSTPFKTKKALAHSLLISHIRYSDLVLGDLDYETYRRLLVAFNSITRYVYNVPRYDHISPYAKCLLGCKLENYLKYKQCMMLFSIIYGSSPSYLKDKIKVGSSLRYLTLITPKHSSAFRARFFFINGVQSWNSISSDIKKISHPSQFKTKCFEFFSSL